MTSAEKALIFLTTPITINPWISAKAAINEGEDYNHDSKRDTDDH